MTTQPTMRDVARHAGVSTSTVSLAMSGSPKIPETTRKAVRQAAQELGYRSDPMLAALSAHRWHRRQAPAGTTLALLADGELEGEYGMVKRAATYGYRTEVFQIKDYPTPQRLSHVLFNRGITGLIVGQIFTPGFCAAFEWSRFVSVASSEGCERPPVNLVMPNHFLAIQSGWDHARALGYRRIGLAIFEDPMALDCHDRRAAFLDRQREIPEADRIPILGIKTNPRNFSNKPTPKAQQAASKRKTNKPSMSKWLKLYQPDVVLGFNCGMQWIIHNAGWRIPKHVAFITLWTDESDRETTGLALASHEVGSRAIDWLDSLLRSGERGLPLHPATMSVDLLWQAGETALGL